MVENDANVAAWAEFRYGAARDADDSMVHVHRRHRHRRRHRARRRLVRGANGIAAELGHMLAVPDGHPCGCGRLGCIEQYASGNALVRFARAGARQEPAARRELLDLAGGDADAITGPMVTAGGPARRPGRARDAFAQVGHWLGIGARRPDPDRSTRRSWSSAAA